MSVAIDAILAELQAQRNGAQNRALELAGQVALLNEELTKVKQGLDDALKQISSLKKDKDELKEDVSHLSEMIDKEPPVENSD